MTLLSVLDYLAKHREDAEESGVLLERLAPIILSRPYLLERAVAEAWPFVESSIVKICIDHSLEVSRIDAAIAKSEAGVTPEITLLPHSYQPSREVCVVCGKLPADICHDVDI